MSHGKPDQRSAEAREYRALYNSAAWRGPQGRRARQLRAEPLCRMCSQEGRLTQATVADHITPHRGDRGLFAKGALQSLCDTCHSRHKQQIETLGYDTAVGEDGFPLDPRHPSNRACP